MITRITYLCTYKLVYTSQCLLFLVLRKERNWSTDRCIFSSVAFPVEYNWEFINNFMNEKAVLVLWISNIKIFFLIYPGRRNICNRTFIHFPNEFRVSFGFYQPQVVKPGIIICRIFSNFTFVLMFSFTYDNVFDT